MDHYLLQVQGCFEMCTWVEVAGKDTGQNGTTASATRVAWPQVMWPAVTGAIDGPPTSIRFLNQTRGVHLNFELRFLDNEQNLSLFPSKQANERI